MIRIGDQLLQHGLIEPGALAAALEQQAAQGGYLGQHLVDGGYVTRQQLYDGLALQWELPRRDLDREPPDVDLLGPIELERAIELGWVPCEIAVDGEVVVATSVRPGPDLVEEVREQFPARQVRYVACTRRDLDHLAVRVRRERAAAAGPTPAAGRFALCRSVAARDAWAGAAAVTALAAVVAAPPAALVAVLGVAGAIVLSAAVVQSWAALATAVREGTRRPEGRADGESALPRDVLLPTYSVLVAVRGQHEVDRALEALGQLAYPSSRLDAVLVVGDADTEALAAVRRAAPPTWVRVATCPSRLFADPVAVYDEALALARGRYVVALSPYEVPARDQLCRAVTDFEADLAENLTVRPGRAPLAGVRVEHRVRGARWSLATVLDELDRTLVLDRAHPWRGPAADLRHELTAVHFNAGVLRRLGGWRCAVAGGSGAGDAGARMGRLDSVTRDQRRPRLWTLVEERAESLARVLRTAALRAKRLGHGAAPGAARPVDVLLGLALPALMLAYPVGLAAAVGFAIRRSELSSSTFQLGLAGLAALAWGLLLAMGVALVLGARRQGWRACGQALLLPALWLVHAAAAWYAALVLLPCRPPDTAAAPTSPLGGRSGWSWGPPGRRDGDGRTPVG